MDHNTTYVLLVELFDVEYYGDLEMCVIVRGHSRSLKVVPFESFGAVSYSPSTSGITMALSCIVCEM